MSDDRELFKDIYRVPSARLKGWDYSFPGWYYLTICTANKECLFGEICGGEMQLNPIGEIVRQEWERSFEIRKELAQDAYVIMPDHVHAIVVIKSVKTQRHSIETRSNIIKTQGNPIETHGNIVETHGRASLRELSSQIPRRAPKSISSFIAGFKSGATRRINGYRETPRLPVWQTRFYDVIIRSDKELYAIRQYINENPKNWRAGEIYDYA
jgi:putative transposase